MLRCRPLLALGLSCLALLAPGCGSGGSSALDSSGAGSFETVLPRVEAAGTDISLEELLRPITGLDPATLSVQAGAYEPEYWVRTGPALWERGEAVVGAFLNSDDVEGNIDQQIVAPQEFTWPGQRFTASIGGEGSVQVRTADGVQITPWSEKVVAFGSVEILAYGTSLWGEPSNVIGVVPTDSPEDKRSYVMDGAFDTHLVGLVQDG